MNLFYRPPFAFKVAKKFHLSVPFFLTADLYYIIAGNGNTATTVASQCTLRPANRNIRTGESKEKGK